LDGKKLQAYVGWTGMVSASSLAHFNSTSSDNFETVEIDPQYAEGLGFKKSDVVRTCIFSTHVSLTFSRLK
jgi:peroxin-1